MAHKLIKQTGGLTTGDGRHFQYELDLSKKKPTIKITELPRRPEKVTIPEEGHNKFAVASDKFMVYTVIGADNQHHASNKATKLFGPHWSKVLPDSPSLVAIVQYKFCPVKQFKELLATLPI